MPNIELITLTAVILLASVLAYKSSFLHNKKIGYISLLQIFYLILIPGFLYTIVFSYILDILERPLNTHIFLKDKLLTSLLLLSLLYTYGGIAIHSVAKTISSYFSKNDRGSLVFKVNSHFHRAFSHNLTFIGSATSITCLSLLELNHVSPYPKQSKTIIILLNGVFLGLASILGLSFYKIRKKRWVGLKLFFFSLWAMFIVLIFAARPYLKNAKSYPLTLTMLVAFSLLGGLNIFLYVKKLKNKIRFSLKIPKGFFD